MQYTIPYHKPFSFRNAEVGRIAENPWGYPSAPETIFQASFVENFGLLIQLSTFEKNPKKEFKSPGDPVWKDSCLEFFANFAPKKSNLYLNFEMGAGGGILIGVGEGRENRRPITDFHPYPLPQVTVRDDMWETLLLIPKELIEAVYGKIDWKPGYAFRGNFYKCLEKENGRHFVCWNPVVAEKPDFHRPEFFGDLVLG